MRIGTMHALNDAVVVVAGDEAAPAVTITGTGTGMGMHMHMNMDLDTHTTAGMVPFPANRPSVAVAAASATHTNKTVIVAKTHSTLATFCATSPRALPIYTGMPLPRLPLLRPTKTPTVATIAPPVATAGWRQ
jgi:hypothetical protein